MYFESISQAIDSVSTYSKKAYMLIGCIAIFEHASLIFSINKDGFAIIAFS